MNSSSSGAHATGFFLINAGSEYLSAEFLTVGKDGRFSLLSGKKSILDRKHEKSAVGHVSFYKLKHVISDLLADIGPIDHLKLAKPNVVCVYLPSVVRHDLGRAVISEKQPFSVTPQVLAAALKKLDKSDTNVDDASYSDERVLSVSINGYNVSSYLNKKVTDLSITAFRSKVEPEIRKTVLKAIYSCLPEVSLEESTFAVHLLSFIGKNLAGKSGLVICNLPDSTMFVAVKNGVIYHADSVFYGEGDVIKSLGAKLSSLPIVSRSYLELLFEGKLHGKQEEIIKAATIFVVRDYYEDIKNLISDKISNHLLGGSVYLLPTSDIGVGLASLLASPADSIKPEAFSEIPKLMEYDRTQMFRDETDRFSGSTIGAIELSDLIVSST